jgi:ribokinase
LKSNHSAIILGDINNDIILHINEHPIEGNESIVTTSSIRVGGSACNTAVLLAKLGLNTQLVGHIAKDPLGQVALDSISGTGLDCSLVKKYDNQTSGFITITVTPGGQRTMYSYRGCNAIPYDIETIKQQIGKKGILHISGYTFLEINQFDSILEIVKIAKERHILISLDPGVQAIKSVPQRFFQILPFIDLLLISDRELEILYPDGSIYQGIQDLWENGIKIITLKRGVKGSACFISSSQHFAPTQNPERVIDTTGAGDAFDAGFILGYIHELNPIDCLTLGNSIARLIITTDGGLSSLLNVDIKSAIINRISDLSGDIEESSLNRLLSVIRNQ